MHKRSMTIAANFQSRDFSSSYSSFLIFCVIQRNSLRIKFKSLLSMVVSIDMVFRELISLKFVLFSTTLWHIMLSTFSNSFISHLIIFDLLCLTTSVRLILFRALFTRLCDFFMLSNVAKYSQMITSTLIKHITY